MAEKGSSDHLSGRREASAPSSTGCPLQGRGPHTAQGGLHNAPEGSQDLDGTSPGARGHLTPDPASAASLRCARRGQAHSGLAPDSINLTHHPAQPTLCRQVPARTRLWRKLLLYFFIWHRYCQPLQPFCMIQVCLVSGRFSHF